jgi:hypothetical protein
MRTPSLARGLSLLVACPAKPKSVFLYVSTETFLLSVRRGVHLFLVDIGAGLALPSALAESSRNPDPCTRSTTSMFSSASKLSPPRGQVIYGDQSVADVKPTPERMDLRNATALLGDLNAGEGGAHACNRLARGEVFEVVHANPLGHSQAAW